MPCAASSACPPRRTDSAPSSTPSCASTSRGAIEDLMEREGLSRDAAEREAKRRFGDVAAYRAQDPLDRRHDVRPEKRAWISSTPFGRETRHAARVARAHAVLLADRRGHARTRTRRGDDDLHAARSRRASAAAVSERRSADPHRHDYGRRLKAGGDYAISRGQYFYFRNNSSALADLLLYDEDMLAGARRRHASRRSASPAVDVSHTAFHDPRHSAAARASAHRRRRAAARRRRSRCSRSSIGSGDSAAIRHRRAKRFSLEGELTANVVGVLAARRARARPDAGALAAESPRPERAPHNNHTHLAIGLLKPGVTVEAAAADIKRLQDHFANDHPTRTTRRIRRKNRLRDARDVAARSRDRRDDRSRAVARCSPPSGSCCSSPRQTSRISFSCASTRGAAKSRCAPRLAPDARSSPSTISPRVCCSRSPPRRARSRSGAACCTSSLSLRRRRCRDSPKSRSTGAALRSASRPRSSFGIRVRHSCRSDRRRSTSRRCATRAAGSRLRGGASLRRRIARARRRSRSRSCCSPVPHW